MLLILLAMISFGFNAKADHSLPGVDLETASMTPYVLYGTDNRTEIADSKITNIQTFASATLTLLEKKRVVKSGDLYSADAKTIEDEFELCQSERFREQPTLGFCSGVLVGPDLVLTAAHCVPDLATCQQTQFVFDYTPERVSNTTARFEPNSVYSCRALLSVNHDDHREYALIRLDRPVTERQPIKIRKGPLSNAPLALVGSPLGLPLKASGPSRVLRKGKLSFYVDTDSYDGNSGSPLFNIRTGELEGILIGGEDDFEWTGLKTRAAACRVSRVCKENECNGEEATDASIFKDIVAQVLNVSVSSQLLNAPSRTGSIPPR